MYVEWDMRIIPLGRKSHRESGSGEPNHVGKVIIYMSSYQGMGQKDLNK